MFDLDEFYERILGQISEGLTRVELASIIEMNIDSLRSRGDQNRRQKGKSATTIRYTYDREADTLNKLLHEIKYMGFTNVTGSTREAFDKIKQALAESESKESQKSNDTD